ncbi:uncharacterized protein KZ484_021879 [Pholidichthys leucotaenia]
MDDTTLIVEIKKHKELYDPHDPFYKDNRRKEKAWEAIGAAVGAEVDDCKRRWKVLRDAFVKNVKQKNLPNGSVREWKYEKLISFVLPHVQRRSSRSSLQTVEVKEELTESMELSAVEEEDATAMQPKLEPSSPTPSTSSQRPPSPIPSVTSQRSATPTPHPSVQALITDSPQTRAPRRWRRRGSPIQPGIEQQLLDIIKQPATNTPPHVPTSEEEMYYFALSLVPRLNRLSRATQGEAQIHILTYLSELEEREHTGASTPAHSPN